MNLMQDKIKYHYSIFKKYGLRATLFLFLSKFKKNKTANIHIPGLRAPLNLSNFNNDVTTMFQIFFTQEYKMPPNLSPSVIIDCGANIGLSAVFFANQFPEAKIIAVEPETDNFNFLLANARPYLNITCINKAIWSHSTDLDIISSGTGNWGVQTKQAAYPSTTSVKSISIPKIMEDFDLLIIDILKIDIEGAEKELFSNQFEEWLGKVKVLAIELHENIDKDIPAIFYNALKDMCYHELQQGENLICDFRKFQ